MTQSLSFFAVFGVIKPLNRTIRYSLLYHGLLGTMVIDSGPRSVQISVFSEFEIIFKVFDISIIHCERVCVRV